MKFLATTTQDLFGTIAPPPGSPGSTSDPIIGIAKLFGVALQLILLVAAILLLIYLLWGALDWLTSGGEKEKILKAQNKIVNAVVGMVLVIAVFTVFALINDKVLGNKIIDTSGGSWRLIIPTIGP